MHLAKPKSGAPFWPGLNLRSNRKPVAGQRSTSKSWPRCALNLSPRYGHLILVSGYLVLTGVNWPQHGCPISNTSAVNWVVSWSMAAMLDYYYYYHEDNIDYCPKSSSSSSCGPRPRPIPLAMITMRKAIDGFRLQLGVAVHEFMLISICQCLCHIMKVSWNHGFIGFLVSMVS